MNELLILGLAILVGFVGNTIFKYTKIPESFFMILIGLAIGPIFKIVDYSEFVHYAPLVASITLVIVLLDSGLKFNIFNAPEMLSKAIKFTGLVLVFSTIFVGFFTYLLGWDPLHAILIGVISSGTTTIIAAFLLPRLSIPKEIKQILFMESVINDVTIVTAAIVIVQIIQFKAFDLSQAAYALIGPIIIAIVVGLIFTILWVDILWKFYKGEELAYVFTLGMLFLLYSVVELIGGSGAIAVLVLSFSLGNIPIIVEKILIREEVHRKFNFESGFWGRYTKILEGLKERFNEILVKIRRTQVDFTFFIKNFFFVYLGAIFNLESMNSMLMITCIAIILLIVISRYVSVRILASFEPKFKKYTMIMTTMVARGFTATFVALLPSTKGIEIPQLKEVMLLIVLISTFVTILGSVVYERQIETKQENAQNLSNKPDNQKKILDP